MDKTADCLGLIGPTMAPLKHVFGDVVQPHILPLVESLNIPGVCETTSSREGTRIWNLKYPWPPAFIPPNVWFHAQAGFAAALDGLIHETLHCKPQALHFSWRLMALDEYRRYLLSSPYLDGYLHAAVREFAWRWPETRARIDQDFRTLAGLVSLALSQWRQAGEPDFQGRILAGVRPETGKEIAS